MSRPLWVDRGREQRRRLGLERRGRNVCEDVRVVTTGCLQRADLDFVTNACLTLVLRRSIRRPGVREYLARSVDVASELRSGEIIGGTYHVRIIAGHTEVRVGPRLVECIGRNGP